MNADGSAQARLTPVLDSDREPAWSTPDSTTNRAPNAVDDSASIRQDSGQNGITVLANDTDLDDDTLTVTEVTRGASVGRDRGPLRPQL